LCCCLLLLGLLRLQGGGGGGGREGGGGGGGWWRFNFTFGFADAERWLHGHRPALCGSAPQESWVWVQVRWSQASFRTRLSCVCMCLQSPSPPDPKDRSGSFWCPVAAPLPGRKQPSSRRSPLPAPRPGGASSASAEGNLMGAPQDGPRFARRSAGVGVGSPASGASDRARSGVGRWAWPERPASWGLGRRHSAGTRRPASRRPAPGLALGLCHYTCPDARGARVACPQTAPRPGVIGPSCGLAPGAAGSPPAPPGRPGALGPTRLRYGAGEVGAGSLRGLCVAPCGQARGPTSPWGPGARAGGGGVGTRVPAPCPPTRSGRRVTFARRPNMVGAEPPPPPLPFRVAGPAMPVVANRGARVPARSRRHGLGPAPQPPREAVPSAKWNPSLPRTRRGPGAALACTSREQEREGGWPPSHCVRARGEAGPRLTR
jgi:hypothetical protein